MRWALLLTRHLHLARLPGLNRGMGLLAILLLEELVSTLRSKLWVQASIATWLGWIVLWSLVLDTLLLLLDMGCFHCTMCIALHIRCARV